MEKLLKEIVRDSLPFTERGKPASYIPELAKGNPKALGAAVTDISGKQWCAGDTDESFSIQSIIKVVTLSLALQLRGADDVFSHVGVNAVADPFNSIMRLEMDSDRQPQNPMINSGAIVVVSLLPQDTVERRVAAVRDLYARMSGDDDSEVVDSVYISEKRTGDRNRSLAYFLRSAGTLSGDVDDILDAYFQCCAISTTAGALSVMGATLAADGKNPVTGEEVIMPWVARTVRAIMITCGMYDGSGEFAVNVGIPAKSGVGGGIMGTFKGRGGIGTFGPALDARGNSTGGLEIFRLISEAGYRVI